MAKLYYNRIKLGLMMLEDVPELWRAGVEALLLQEVESNENTEG